MTIIELLNKIANGEIKKISKFIYKGRLYEEINNFNDLHSNKTYISVACDNVKEIKISQLFDINNLNDIIEILEEENKIEKITPEEAESNFNLGAKINELIDEINKLKEDK